MSTTVIALPSTTIESAAARTSLPRPDLPWLEDVAVSLTLAVTVVVFLAVAGAEFAGFERAFGKTLVYGIPIWAIELVFPLGFALIAARLLYRGSDQWHGRLAAAALAAGAIALVALVPNAVD